MSARALFPAHVRTFDDATDFLASWVEMIGGSLLGELETLETPEALHVPAGPITLAQVATKIVATHVNLAG